MVKFITRSMFVVLITLQAQAKEPVIGGPCQGCELVFMDMPSELRSHSSITQPDEKGEKMLLSGKVFKQDGSIASGIIIYAYQTNNVGVYPKGDTVHGMLRGWAVSDKNGKYSFNTIRPKAYPDRSEPQHIHLHVIEPNKGTYYIDSVEFTDDPLLTKVQINKRKCRGGCGVTTPHKNERGIWIVLRDIYLGKAISKQ